MPLTVIECANVSSPYDYNNLRDEAIRQICGVMPPALIAERVTGHRWRQDEMTVTASNTFISVNVQVKRFPLAHRTVVLLENQHVSFHRILLYNT